MNGQLWQECEICGTEPVCADCHYCETHCTCQEREQAHEEPEGLLLPAQWDKAYRGQDKQMHTLTNYRSYVARIADGDWQVGTEEWTWTDGGRSIGFTVALAGSEADMEQAKQAAENAINELAN